MSGQCPGARDAVLAIEARMSSGLEAQGPPRARAACAMGRAMAGDRAALLVEPHELASLADLLHEARRRRISLVVHCLGAAPGSELDLPTLAAETMQESVDAAVVARRLAEDAMSPVLVVHAHSADGEPDLPTEASVRDFVGTPDDEVDTPTEGQVVVFGDRRRRVHRLFDVDRPVSLGGRMADDEAWSAEVGGRLFYDREIPRLASRLRRRWTEQCGREVPAVELPAVELPAVEVPSSSEAKAAAEAQASSGSRTTWDLEAWPRRQVLESRLRRLRPDLPVLDRAKPPSVRAPSPRLVDDGSLPLAARRLGRGEETWDDVARFWTEHVQPRAGGAPPVPDPYLALEASPAWTATFYDQGRSERPPPLPRLDTERCVACGLCWQACPEASLAPRVVETREVLEQIATGIEGWDASLRRHLRPLARTIDSDLAAGASWRQAVDGARSGPAEEALDGLLDPLLDRAQKLPLIASSTDETHDLLLLAVEPRSCSGCGLCVEECPEDALELVERRDEEDSARRAFLLWQQLPDTDGATIDRWAQRPEIGPVAAAMLSPSCGGAVAGGGPVPVDTATERPGPSSVGLQIAMRQLVARVEAHMQRRWLAEAEALAKLSQGEEGRRADAERLRALQWLLTEGRTGAGRSRFAVVAAGTSVADWCGHFGRHPLGVPLAVWESASSLDLALDLALGLAQTLSRRRVDEARIVRRARLLLERPADLVRRMDELHRLTWLDLDADERGSTPPVLLLADAETIARVDLAALERLRASQRPLWLVVFDERGPGGSEAGPLDVGSPDAALLAAAAVLGLPVASTSIAAPSHLAMAVQSLLGPDLGHGPAVLRIHAPSPSADGFAPSETVRVARDALESGQRSTVIYLPDPAAPYRFTGSMPEEAARRASADTADSLRARHEAELKELRDEHAARLRVLDAETQAAVAARLKARLMGLAGLGESGGRDQTGRRGGEPCSR